MSEQSYLMLPVADALAIVLAQATPLPPVLTPLAAAHGAVLAADVVAPDPLPPFPAAVKDGYAVIAADGPGDYPVVGAGDRRPAGRVCTHPGCGCVHHHGRTAAARRRRSGDGRRDRHPCLRATACQPSGSAPQYAPAAMCAPSGMTLPRAKRCSRPGHTWARPKSGSWPRWARSRLPVYPRPRVAILSTGDELVEAGQPLAPGQIRDSNRPMLAAAVAAAGGVVVDLGIAGDSQAELEARVRMGLENADILLTSGGVSMGNLDLMKSLLERAGTVHFGRLRMKPGKPLTFATDSGGWAAAADLRPARQPGEQPGHLLPARRARACASWPAGPIRRLRRVQMPAGPAAALDPYRPEYHRAILRWEPTLDGGRGGLLATSTGNQASSRLLSLRSANALLELPQGEGMLPARGGGDGAVDRRVVTGDCDW